MLPTYNHTRGDSELYPCPECQEQQKHISAEISLFELKELERTIDGLRHENGSYLELYKAVKFIPSEMRTSRVNEAIWYVERALDSEGNMLT